MQVPGRQPADRSLRPCNRSAACSLVGETELGVDVMLRTLLLLLAFVVLIGAVLVWLGIIDVGNGQVEVNPVNVSVQDRDVSVNMNVPVPVIERPGEVVNQAVPTTPVPAPAPAQ